MHNQRARTGIAAFVFAILLLLFNWPVLSIPAPGRLLAWLFCAWGLAIALLGLAAFLAGRAERRQGAGPAGPECAPGPLDSLGDCLDDRPGGGDV